MFKHILIPLDGSALAEVVLPVAHYLARVLGRTSPSSISSSRAPRHPSTVSVTSPSRRRPKDIWKRSLGGPSPPTFR